MAIANTVNTGLGSIAFGASPIANPNNPDLNRQIEEELLRLSSTPLKRDFSDNGGYGPSEPEFAQTSPLLRDLIRQRERAKSGQFGDIDELIQSRAPQAIDILRQGSGEQLRLAGLGLQESLRPLEQVRDLRAFDETQSILGLRGQGAQEQAIGNISVSDFDKELNRRQQQQLRRAASASGELGGGASLLAGQQLAGAQQADIIQKRLAQLQPLVALSRGVSQDISSLTERGGAEQAQLQSALGSQIGNIRLGTAAPAMQSVQQKAELSGLNRIASANQRAQTANQLAGLAGTIFGGG